MVLDLENYLLSFDFVSKVICYVFSLCIVVDCCVDVFDFDMLFYVYLFIDLCWYIFRIGIDKYSFIVLLD